MTAEQKRSRDKEFEIEQLDKRKTVLESQCKDQISSLTGRYEAKMIECSQENEQERKRLLNEMRLKAQEVQSSYTLLEKVCRTEEASLRLWLRLPVHKAILVRSYKFGFQAQTRMHTWSPRPRAFPFSFRKRSTPKIQLKLVNHKPSRRTIDAPSTWQLHKAYSGPEKSLVQHGLAEKRQTSWTVQRFC